MLEACLRSDGVTPTGAFGNAVSVSELASAVAWSGILMTPSTPFIAGSLAVTADPWRLIFFVADVWTGVPPPLDRPDRTCLRNDSSQA